MAKKQTSETLKGIFFSVLRLVVNLIILYLLIQFFLFAYRFSYQVFADEAYQPYNDTAVMVTVLEQDTMMNAADTLEKEGIIANKYIFILRYKFSKYNGNLKAGTYELSPAMTTDEILAILSNEELETNKGDT